MTDLKMYVVYDKLAEDTGPIFYAKNDDHAIRMMAHLMVENRNDGTLPGDIQDDIFMQSYRLTYIGTIDSRTCKLSPADPCRDIDYHLKVMAMVAPRPNLVEVNK